MTAFDKQYTNKLERLFVRVSSTTMHYVGQRAYCALPNGCTISGEIIGATNHPALKLSAISKYCGVIDNITIPLPSAIQQETWSAEMSSAVINIAIQVDEYVDAFRN